MYECVSDPTSRAFAGTTQNLLTGTPSCDHPPPIKRVTIDHFTASEKRVPPPLPPARLISSLGPGKAQLAPKVGSARQEGVRRVHGAELDRWRQSEQDQQQRQQQREAGLPHAKRGCCYWFFCGPGALFRRTVCICTGGAAAPLRAVPPLAPAARSLTR